MNNGLQNSEITIKKERDSNIELFRVFLMLMIIAFHYVGNSGIQDFFDFNHVSSNQIFLELFGWGGKVGINCFLLITGFFMCKKQFTWKKLLKLYLEVKFYAILIFAIFCISGYEKLTLLGIYRITFNVALGIGHEFAASFIALFLLVPFINKLIFTLKKQEFIFLIILLLIIYSVIGTFSLNSFFEYIGWYVTVYLIGSYIRFYPFKMSQNKSFAAKIAILSLLISWGSILILTYVPQLHRFGIDIYYFVFDSNRILAIFCAVAFFLFFRSLNLGCNRIINTLASSTFGVLLIHGHSDTMRQWLWNDIFNVKNQFTSETLWLHAICTVAIVYLVCVFIDLLRQYFVQRPFFNWLSKTYPKLK